MKPTPEQLLEVARETGLRGFLHGVNATDARDLLELHDAMLEVATVNDMERAIQLAKDKKRAEQNKRPKAHS